MSLETLTGRVRRRIGDPARALAIAQVTAIVVVGVATVARFHIFAVVDEAPHMAYVQEVAEHGRLPWLGRSYLSWQELAIERHTYPRPSSLDARLIGFRGSGYEAWQPPLYYALAAPAYLAASDYRHRVFAVRAFDLLLLLIAVAILALLARTVFKTNWRGPYCLGLATILWPGVIVRAITVSNAALELPLVLLYVLLLWRATETPRARTLVAAGAVFGLCVLTQLTLAALGVLLLVPLAAWMRGRPRAEALGPAALALVLPVVLVAPWLASNVSRYGALTASGPLERMQEAYEPGTRRYGVGEVISQLWRFTRAALPQEWWPEYRGLIGALMIALPALVLGMALLPVARVPRLLRSRHAALLAAPLALGFLTLVGIVLAAGWQSSFIPRFLNPTIPAFALFAAYAWSLGGIGRRFLLPLAALASAGAMAGWIYVAGAYYFTHVGGALGIHAAA